VRAGRADEEDAGDAGGFGGAEDGAEVAGGADVFDDEVAEAGTWGRGVRRPLLADDGADAAGAFGEADGAELFRCELEAGDAPGVEFAGEFFGEGALEEDFGEDDGVEGDIGVVGLDEVADAFDPVGGLMVAGLGGGEMADAGENVGE